jgi:hypothetical protein
MIPERLFCVKVRESRIYGFLIVWVGGVVKTGLLGEADHVLCQALNAYPKNYSCAIPTGYSCPGDLVQSRLKTANTRLFSPLLSGLRTNSPEIDLRAELHGHSRFSCASNDFRPTVSGKTTDRTAGKEKSPPNVSTGVGTWQGYLKAPVLSLPRPSTRRRVSR